MRADELYQLYVSAAARASGVAAAVLADGEARLAAGGAATAWLACAIGNERAARLYARHGWRRVGTMVNRLDTPDGEFRLDVWRFEKRLVRPATPAEAVRAELEGAPLRDDSPNDGDVQPEA